MSEPLFTRARASALLLGSTVLASARIAGAAQTAAPLKILTFVVPKALLDVIVPIFETASGRSVVVQYVAGKQRVDTVVAAGEPFDIVISNGTTMDTLVKQGWVVPDSQAVLGSSIHSLAYRSGTPKPDTSTLAALKAVVLNAKAISLSDPALGGGSSLYFDGLMQQLGIAEDVQRKAIFTKSGEGAFPVGDGRADVGVAQTTEVALVPGVASVPISPSDPKGRILVPAGVSTKSPDASAARAFLRFLFTPDATALRKAKGFVLEP